MVRVAHFSPDAPAVDVYVNDDKVLSGVRYKTVSEYLEPPAGSYDLAVRPAGLAASSDPVIEATAAVEGRQRLHRRRGRRPGRHQGAHPRRRPERPRRRQGQGPGHPALPPRSRRADVAVGRMVLTLFEGAKFPSATDYAEVAAGTYPLQVKAASGGDVLLEASLPVKGAGTIYSVAAVGGAGKDVELLRIVDATGMGQMPGGGVATGAGGTALGAPGPRPQPGPGRRGLVLAVAWLGTGVLLGRRAGSPPGRRRAGVAGHGHGLLRGVR